MDYLPPARLKATFYEISPRILSKELIIGRPVELRTISIISMDSCFFIINDEP
jgi:hypothetical protein